LSNYGSSITTTKQNKTRTRYGISHLSVTFLLPHKDSSLVCILQKVTAKQSLKTTTTTTTITTTAKKRRRGIKRKSEQLNERFKAYNGFECKRNLSHYFTPF